MYKNSKKKYKYPRNKARLGPSLFYKKNHEYKEEVRTRLRLMNHENDFTITEIAIFHILASSFHEVM